MIFTLHGIVEKISTNCQSTRSLVEQSSFENFLKGQKAFFRRWDRYSSALDLLTIDDATVAGANACLIAKKLGHHVVLFINPWQIINNKTYFFNLLNIAIDNRQNSIIKYAGVEYQLESYKSIKIFRFSVKQNLVLMNPNDALEHVDQIAFDLKSNTGIIPEFLRTLKISEIKELHNMGIQIESHGWSHMSIAALSKNGLVYDITSSINWINDTLNKKCTMYAVPFGKPKIHDKVISEMNLDCFLSDPIFPKFNVESNCWNRYEITSDLRNKI